MSRAIKEKPYDGSHMILYESKTSKHIMRRTSAPYDVDDQKVPLPPHCRFDSGDNEGTDEEGAAEPRVEANESGGSETANFAGG